MKRPIIFGMLAGGIMILFTVIFQLVDPTYMFTHPLMAMLTGFVLPFSFMVIGGIRERKISGGTMAYGEALKVTYVIWIVMMVLSSVYGIIYHNIIDPGFFDRNQEVMIKAAEEMTIGMVKQFGGSEADAMSNMEDNRANMEKQMQTQQNQFKTFTGILSSIGMLFVIGILVALIAALIVKKNPKPVSME